MIFVEKVGEALGVRILFAFVVFTRLIIKPRLPVTLITQEQ